MSTPVEKIAKFTGLSQDDIKTVWEEARANAKRLDGCPGPHDFVGIGPAPQRKHRCTVCGGEVDLHAAHWYQRGLEHGRNS